MNWSQRLRLFEVIIAGMVPLKLCLADIQVELFTRSSSVELFPLAQEEAPLTNSPLDEIAREVNSWNSADHQDERGDGSSDGESQTGSSFGINVTQDRYEPKVEEHLQDFIFSRFRRLASGD